jgi:imidazolonepropionase-like amidohydrolase/quinol monooxygenase YgiN
MLAVMASALPATAHAQMTVLTHATIIDGNGGAPRRDATLVIDGETIRSISATSGASLPGATVIDATGKTIMPEIVNAHGHVGLLKGTTLSADHYTEENIERQLLQYQDYGIGAVLVLGTDHDEAYAWHAQSLAGTRPGAYYYTAGRGFGVKEGLPPVSFGMDAPYRPTTPEEARADVRELAAHHPDFVKLWVDDFWGQYPKMKPEIYAAIIDEAHRQHLRAVAHLYHLEDAQRLVDLGVDVIAHSVRDDEIPDSLLAEMKRKHVTYIATLTLDDFAVAYEKDPAWLNDPFFRNALEPGSYAMITSEKYRASVRDNKVTAAERAALPIAMKNLKRVYDAGVRVALGTDSGASPVRFFGFAEHKELELLVEAGLTPLEAITVATRNGADLLKASAKFGTLEPGKKADFIVLDKDPSTKISNTQTISAVWKDGRKVSDGPHPYKVAIVARFKILPGHEAEVMRSIDTLSTLTRQEAGCERFVFNVEKDDPTRVVMEENFVNQAGFQAHLDAPYVRTFLAGLKTSVEGGKPSLIMLNQVSDR